MFFHLSVPDTQAQSRALTGSNQHDHAWCGKKEISFTWHLIGQTFISVQLYQTVRAPSDPLNLGGPPKVIDYLSKLQLNLNKTEMGSLCLPRATWLSITSFMNYTINADRKMMKSIYVYSIMNQSQTIGFHGLYMVHKSRYSHHYPKFRRG